MLVSRLYSVASSSSISSINSSSSSPNTSGILHTLPLLFSETWPDPALRRDRHPRRPVWHHGHDSLSSLTIASADFAFIFREHSRVLFEVPEPCHLACLSRCCSESRAIRDDIQPVKSQALLSYDHDPGQACHLPFRTDHSSRARAAAAVRASRDCARSAPVSMLADITGYKLRKPRCKQFSQRCARACTACR